MEEDDFVGIDELEEENNINRQLSKLYADLMSEFLDK